MTEDVLVRVGMVSGASELDRDVPVILNSN